MLVERGHSVALAVQEHVDTREEQYRGAVDSPRFSLVRCPAHRVDDWADVARLLRNLRDCAHYQQTAMRNAVKLQARSIQKLREELRVSGDNESVAGALRELPPLQIQRLDAVFGLAERQLPSDPLYDSFFAGRLRTCCSCLRSCISVGAGRLSASARKLGIPSGCCFTDGTISAPRSLLGRADWMFVWNGGRRRSRARRMDFREPRVVAGARVDASLMRRSLRARVSRAARDSDRRPCSTSARRSRVDGEAFFLRKVAAIRGRPARRDCNLSSDASDSHCLRRRAVVEITCRRARPKVCARRRDRGDRAEESAGPTGI